jgi:hypothetical protein
LVGIPWGRAQRADVDPGPEGSMTITTDNHNNEEAT